MSINKAENKLEAGLVNAVAKHERDIREMKSAIQPIGGDSIKVQTTSLITGGPVNLTAGSSATMVVTVYPTASTLTLWNFLFTVLVDGTTAADAFPAGANLTTAKRNMRLYNWIDWADSSDTTNVRVVKIRIENYDTASHNYYLWFKGYFPYLAGTTAG